jgi:hypothetical protein
LVFNLCGCWIINYVSGKASAGSGAHNKTIIYNLQTTGTIAANQESVLAANSINIPETDYYINGLGAMFRYMSNSTGLPSCVCVQAERLTAEGGMQWETLYLDASVTDALVGIHNIYSQSRTIFKRFPSDYESTRIDVETNRRYKSSFSPALGWRTFNMMLTYHSIIFTVSGTVSGSAGGTVTLRMVNNYDKKMKKETTRSGNGAYSFTWYDDTQQVWIDAYEDSTHVFRSAPGYAS